MLVMVIIICSLLISCGPRTNSHKNKQDRISSIDTIKAEQYNHNTKEKFHERSILNWEQVWVYKNYQFGLAANFDHYGRAKILKEN